MKTPWLLAAPMLLLLASPAGFASNNAQALQSLEQQMLANNPQVLALESKVEAQKATVQSRTGAYYPELALVAGYEENKTRLEPSAGYLGYLNASWNIFKGGEDAYRREISSREARISQLDLELKKRALRRELRELYFQILAHKKQLLVLDEKEVFLKRQRQMADKKISAGLTSNVDGLEVDLEENSLFSERQAIASEISRLREDLRLLLHGDVPEGAISATDSFIWAPKELPIEKVLLTNPAIQRQEFMEEVAQTKVSQQRSGFIPRLDLNASYGQITPAYSNPAQESESKVALLMTWNLFSGMTNYYESKAASFEAKSQSLEKKNTATEVKKTLVNLATQKDSLVKIHEFQIKRLSLVQKYYELTLAEYKRGVKNFPDLQSATSSFFEAKLKMIGLEKDISIVDSKIDELI